MGKGQEKEKEKGGDGMQRQEPASQLESKQEGKQAGRQQVSQQGRQDIHTYTHISIQKF